jgi:hypothetical protein
MGRIFEIHISIKTLTLVYVFQSYHRPFSISYCVLWVPGSVPCVLCPVPCIHFTLTLAFVITPIGCLIFPPLNSLAYGTLKLILAYPSKLILARILYVGIRWYWGLIPFVYGFVQLILGPNTN